MGALRARDERLSQFGRSGRLGARRRPGPQSPGVAAFNTQEDGGAATDVAEHTCQMLCLGEKEWFASHGSGIEMAPDLCAEAP